MEPYCAMQVKGELEGPGSLNWLQSRDCHHGPLGAGTLDSVQRFQLFVDIVTADKAKAKPKTAVI